MSVNLTEAAAAHVRAYAAKQGQAAGLRLGLKVAGCSGLSYVVELAPKASGDELVFESAGVPVYVLPRDLPFLDGTEIDYRREGLNASFHFTNPNEKGSCGCGESFTV
ncbi:MAG: iron-sulfur cluster assembly accessory protein [Chromatiales bacterium]|nr:iron-sulfur cluster assembly accessory protein [Chromatiales bacterium]